MNFLLPIGADGLHDEIYEAISNGQKYIGMENWLPLFYNDVLPTLFDYLPNAQVVAGKNTEEALKSKTEGIADYYEARLEALQVKSKNDTEAYRPLPPEKRFSPYIRSRPPDTALPVHSIDYSRRPRRN